MRGSRRHSRLGAVSTLIGICLFATCLSLIRLTPLPTAPAPAQFSSFAIDHLQPYQDVVIARPARPTPRRRRAPAAQRELEMPREAVSPLPDAAPPVEASIDASIQKSIETPVRDVPLDASAIANSLVLSDVINVGGIGSRGKGMIVRSGLDVDRRVPKSMRTMYVALGGLEAADIQLTLRALNAGAREVNPLVSPVTNHPATLVGIKAASVVGTIYLIERLRKRHRVAAAVTMAAIDAGYVAVVVHNSRVASGGAAGAR